MNGQAVLKIGSLSILLDEFLFKPGFHLGFFCLLLPVLVFPAPGSVSAFCCSSSLFPAFHCFSLPVVALSGFSLLLTSTTFHRSRVGTNE